MKKSDFIIRNRIQEAINKHRDDFPLWVKDKTNISLRPTQVLHAEELMLHPKSNMIAPPRFGKTLIVELVDLYDSAINPFEDGRIWAPKEDQAKESLKYQIEAIEMSPILSAFVAREQGKRKISSKGYKFINGSNWRAFGIYGNFEGQNATIIRLEEYDDLDEDIVKNRVMPRGSAANRNGLPTRIRITGTIQAGKGNIYQAFKNPAYFNCSLFEVTVGLLYGYYDKDIIDQARNDLTKDEFLRIWMLVFTEAKNFIQDRWVRMAIEKGIRLNYDLIDPYELTDTYQAQGVVYGGLDMGDSGESKTASKYVAQFIESVGNKYYLWLGGKEWDATENPKVVQSEYADLCEIYGARFGTGDALKSDMIRDINQALYSKRLIRTNVDLFPTHSKSSWPDWDFSPVWNTGEFKWLHGVALQKDFELGNIIFPYVDKSDDRPIAKFLIKTKSVLANIKSYKKSPTQKYPTLEAINKVLGDDHFDALVMAKAASMLKYRPTLDLSQISTSGHRTFQGDSMRTQIDRDLYDIQRGNKF